MPLTARFSSVGGPEVITLDQVDVPAPGAGEVRIRTRALALNRADVMFRTGGHFVQPKFPQAFGLEAAGTVESVGPGVTAIHVGDAVSVVPAFGLDEYALHGELVLAPARAVVKHPLELSWEEAAAVWMAYFTAYGGLVDLAGLTSGEVVAIQAASSSVGLAAIQIANMLGATPIALTRTTEKQQQLVDAGAADVIATATDDVTARLNKASRGHGVDVVFDPVAGPTLSRLMAAAAQNARVIVYGLLNADPAPLPVLSLLQNRITIRGYDMQQITADDDRLTQGIHFILAGLQDGRLQPVVDATFALADIADAYRHLEANTHVGKIVITMPQTAVDHE